MLSCLRALLRSRKRLWQAMEERLFFVVMIPMKGTSLLIDFPSSLLIAYFAREVLAKKIAEEKGLTLIPSYDHPHIMAGFLLCFHHSKQTDLKTTFPQDKAP